VWKESTPRVEKAQLQDRAWRESSPSSGPRCGKIDPAQWSTPGCQPGSGTVRKNISSRLRLSASTGRPVICFSLPMRWFFPEGPRRRRTTRRHWGWRYPAPPRGHRAGAGQGLAQCRGSRRVRQSLFAYAVGRGQRKRVGLAQVADPPIPRSLRQPFGPLDAQTRQIRGNPAAGIVESRRKAP